MATLPQQFLLGKKLFVSRKDHAARVLGQALSTPSGPQEMGAVAVGGGQDGSVLRDAFRQIEDYENKRNGVLTYDQSGTQVRVIMGQLPDGSFGFALLDNNNNVILQIGTPGGRTGMAIRDAAGTEQVFLGQVSTSPSYYGMQVRNAVGVEQLVAGVQSAFTAATVSTASATYTSFVDDPVVNATVGPSGQALVCVGAYVGTNAPGQTGVVGARIDGIATDPPSAGVSSSAPSGTAADVSKMFTVTGLSPGSHSFSLAYKLSGGGPAVSFSLRVLTVQPL